MDRNRLLHQLDKVCEEKDEEIKQLKGLIYEKNVEFDHQMNLAKEGRRGLNDEIQDLKNMMAFQKAAAENDVHQLASEKSQLSESSSSPTIPSSASSIPPHDLHVGCQNRRIES